jgi:hypothetical protein
MPSIVKNKVTTSVIFNRVGVPDSDKNFAYLATQNYAVIKSITRFNNNRSNNNRASVRFF